MIISGVLHIWISCVGGGSGSLPRLLIIIITRIILFLHYVSHAEVSLVSINVIHDYQFTMMRRKNTSIDDCMRWKKNNHISFFFFNFRYFFLFPPKKPMAGKWKTNDELSYYSYCIYLIDTLVYYYIIIVFLLFRLVY
jgi:hypothetical protein